MSKAAVVILLLDITTYIKLRQTNKAMNNQRNGSSVSQAEHQRRRQMEAKLFIQELVRKLCDT
ncbi:hypothetical protein NECAME_07848 [Necator americanus]|uniref:Uncharacterized protein n=1 Tax=Necator americanus TaxID=51031 RepID=W2TLT9_NECAM|nr:hypothetical protein NECAME_07848 [Necator americanus]ETN82594.1 hypothetical protein NECAME_07848 [Necator americanus]